MRGCPVLSAEEALRDLGHLVVVLHHLQLNTLPRKLLGLEHVPVAVVALWVLESLNIQPPFSNSCNGICTASVLPAAYSDKKKSSDHVFIYEMHSAIYIELYGTYKPGAFYTLEYW